MLRDRRPLALLLLVLVVAAGCQPGPTPAPVRTPAPAAPPAVTAPPLPLTDPTIGFVLSLTGSAAVYGGPQKKAVELAVEEINNAGGVAGRKLVAIIEDDGSDPAQATAAFQKLINGGKASVIVGPTLSQAALSAAPVAQEARVPVLGISTTAGGFTEIGNFIFRNSLSEAQLLPRTIAAAASQQELKQVALLYAHDDPAARAGYLAFKATLLASNVAIVAEETFASGDRDFTAQLTRIKERHPDAIAVAALADEGARMLEQIARVGIPTTVRIIGSNGLNSATVLKNAGKASEGLIVGAAWHPGSMEPLSQEFVTAYRTRYNAYPDQFAAQAYAGTYIAANALARAGAGAAGDKVREALAATNLKTVLGDFSFTPERNANHPPVVLQVRDGVFTPLK